MSKYVPTSGAKFEYVVVDIAGFPERDAGGDIRLWADRLGDVLAEVNRFAAEGFSVVREMSVIGSWVMERETWVDVVGDEG